MEGKTFARALEWGRERTFPELGVAVTVAKGTNGGNGVIFVRKLLPEELIPKPKRLTRKRKTA